MSMRLTLLPSFNSSPSLSRALSVCSSCRAVNIASSGGASMKSKSIKLLMPIACKTVPVKKETRSEINTHTKTSEVEPATKIEGNNGYEINELK